MKMTKPDLFLVCGRAVAARAGLARRPRGRSGWVTQPSPVTAIGKGIAALGSGIAVVGGGLGIGLVGKGAVEMDRPPARASSKIQST